MKAEGVLSMPRIAQKIAVLAALTVSAATAWSQAANPPAKPTDEMAPMQHGTKPPGPPGPASPLKITFGEQSAEFTPEKLAALPHTTITVYNGHEKANQTFSGVPLIDLIKPLGVNDQPRGKDFRLYIEAEGSDGYFVVYSIAEVTPFIHDGTVIVADTVDGKPIADSGPFQLVATGEKHPARWVRNLVAIRVQHAE
jgi:hypothetical protein